MGNATCGAMRAWSNVGGFGSRHTLRLRRSGDEACGTKTGAAATNVGRMTVYASAMSSPHSKKPLTVVMGNGFVLDFLEFIQGWDLVDTRVGRLLPPAHHTALKYRGLQPGDPFEGLDLWSPEIWPQLYNRIAKRPIQFMDLCAELSRTGSPNTAKTGGKWSIKFGTIEVELRFYLWFLFCDIMRRLDVLCRKPQAVLWPWYKVAQQLIQYYDVTLVS